MKNKLLSGIALLTVFSLTACQQDISQQEALVMAPSVHISLPQVEKDSQTTGKYLVYTGIQTEITEQKIYYPLYSELDDYLDKKQFALLKIAHGVTYELFEGRESLDYVEDWDWDLVRPLGKTSSYNCGYGQIDYNNDGKEEIIYRNIDNGGQMRATIYVQDSGGKRLKPEYSLVDNIKEDLPHYKLQQLWFEKIGENIVTFHLLRKNNSEEFILRSDIVEEKDGKAVFFRLETRKLTVTTEYADNEEKDIFQERILDLSKGDGEAFEELRYEDLAACQKKRQISSAFQTSKLPAGLLEILKEKLAEEQSYGFAWKQEERPLPEDQEHLLTTEEVREYFGGTLPDYEDRCIENAYLVDLDQNGSEELVVFYDSGGTACFAETHIWRKQKNGTPELLYSIPELRRYATLLNYDGGYYFVVGQYNYNTGETVGFHILTAGGDGMLQQYRLDLKNKENRKNWIETYHDKNLNANLEQSLTNYTEKMKKEIEKKMVSTGDYQLIDGNAETPYQKADITFSMESFFTSKDRDKIRRVVDFDNDGRMECVEKIIWYPSSLGIEFAMVADFYKEYDSYMHVTDVHFPCFLSSGSETADSDRYGTIVDPEEMFDKTLAQLWFEEIEQKVYTFCMYRIDGSSDYLLEVSLIEGDKLHPLLQYLLIAEKEYTFGTEPINS